MMLFTIWMMYMKYNFSFEVNIHTSMNWKIPVWAQEITRFKHPTSYNNTRTLLLIFITTNKTKWQKFLDDVAGYNHFDACLFLWWIGVTKMSEIYYRHTHTFLTICRYVIHESCVRTHLYKRSCYSCFDVSFYYGRGKFM